MKKIMTVLAWFLTCAAAMADVCDVTALVRADGAADGKTYFSTAGSSSGSQSHEKPGNLFNGVIGAGSTSDRYYMTKPSVCYALADDWRAGQEIVLKKYVIVVTGAQLANRIPSTWTLKGSLDGGLTYTIPIDSRTITMASSEIKSSSGNYYVITVELPENNAASREFKFEFSASITSAGANAAGAITMGEIQLWGELRDVVHEISYDVSSVAAIYDGQPHAPPVNAVFPLDTMVEYADSESGDYSTTPITRTEVGESEVWLRFSHDGYETRTTSRTVLITNGVINLTKNVREGESDNGDVRHVTASSSLPNTSLNVMNLFNGATGGDTDRWYGGTWFSYSLAEDFLVGNQATLRRYVLKSSSSSTSAASRYPTAWDLYGSLDGVTYDLLLDSRTGLTLDDFPLVNGAYTYVAELPDNLVPFRHYKFVFSRSTNSVSLNEVELYAQIEPERQIIVYGKEDRRVTYTGIPVGIGLTVSSPAEGVTAEYALSEQGPWCAEAPAFTEVTTETRVWFRLSAEGCDTVVDSATVTIDPLTKGVVDITEVLRTACADTGEQVYSVAGTIGQADNNQVPAYPEVLFDGVTGDNMSKRWYVNWANASVAYSIADDYAPDRSVMVAGYQLVVGCTKWEDRRPRAWTLYGSRNGTSYVAVDHVDDADWGAGRTYSRELAALARYRHFKIVFEKLGTGGAISMMEIRLEGVIGDKPGLSVIVR